ncbi:DUF6438 domain-containing protein [Alteriqipengyuania sp. 357]
MLKTVPICALTLALAGCATPGMGDGSAPPPASVDYTVTPCFGFCPSFSMSVSADGKGTYDGERFVKEQGTAAFSASPEEVAAFFDRIAPFRPEESVQYGYENCDGPVATDSPSVKITWHEAGAEPVTLDWYMGCRQPGLTQNREALYKAWQELPLADLVGTDENRQQYAGYE